MSSRALLGMASRSTLGVTQQREKEIGVLLNDGMVMGKIDDT